ncbi:MAG: 4a-hydroxytetrahydrobiopterin dehydratase [Usitatibacter sp.]
MNELARKKCKPCEGGIAALTPEQARALLKGLDGWTLDGAAIAKTYRFKNYHETMAFVNAAAWVSHREDHHPDMAVGYNECRVMYLTHAIDGLSENDFICAAKLDALFEI